MSKTIQVIPIPQTEENIPANSVCSIAGWGKKGTFKRFSKRLLETHVKILDQVGCNKLWNMTLTSRMVCALYPGATCWVWKNAVFDIPSAAQTHAFWITRQQCFHVCVYRETLEVPWCVRILQWVLFPLVTRRHVTHRASQMFILKYLQFCPGSSLYLNMMGFNLIIEPKESVLLNKNISQAYFSHISFGVPSFRLLC